MLMKSYKTELQLTALVNNSEHIKWWSSAQSFNWVSLFFITIELISPKT